MIHRILTAIVLICNMINAAGGTIDPHTPDAKYIEFASQEQFNCVGKICGKYKDGTSFCASAVAIDDHHIITAAHVVKDSLRCSFFINDKEFFLSNVVYNKDFDGKEFGLADIAIGYSKEPFKIKTYPELYNSNDEVGKKCDICGYGFTGTFITGAKYHDNKKRSGSNTVDSIDHNMLICTPSNDKHKTDLEFLIASGDSGGGLFIDGKLAGINSCVMRTNGSPRSIYGDESGHTRISIFIDWITRNKHASK